MPFAPSLLLLLLLAASASGCPYRSRCSFPRNSVYTSHTGGSIDEEECCAVLPPMFLLETGDAVVAPPSGEEEGAYCAPRPGCCDTNGISDLNQTYTYLMDVPNAAVHSLPEGYDPSLTTCTATDPFYTQYTNVYEEGGDYTQGIGLLASGDVPPEALLSTRRTLNEMLTQAGPTIRSAMAAHYSRYIVWGHLESQDPSGCGFDSSAHPEFPCGSEAGGGGIDKPTGGCEELGIPYINASGTNPYYNGRNINIEEFFHTMHRQGIGSADPEGWELILRVSEEGLAAGNVFHDTHGPGCWQDNICCACPPARAAACCSCSCSCCAPLTLVRGARRRL